MPPEPLPYSAGSRLAETSTERNDSTLLRTSNSPFVGWLTLKPSKTDQRLVSLGAGHVRLAVLIGRNAWNERQRVAVVVRRRIRDIENLRAGEFFFGGNLRGIDRGSGLGDIHHLPCFLLARESEI